MQDKSDSVLSLSSVYLFAKLNNLLTNRAPMDCLYQTNPICVRTHIAILLMARLAASARPDLLGLILIPPHGCVLWDA